MSDDTLYLYTSLSAGSSHIVTATSRIETILKANKIPFKAIDCATDDKARMLWGRRSKGRKIPGLVKFGDVIGDLEQIEDWNEYGELKDQIESVDDIFGDVPISATTAEAQAAAAARASGAQNTQERSRSSSETRHISISDPKDQAKEGGGAAKKEDTPLAMAMRQAGAEAAMKAGQRKASSTAAVKLPAKDTTDVEALSPAEAAENKLKREVEEPSTENTAARVPAVLAAEGSERTSIDKITSPTEPEITDPDTAKSNEEQVLNLTRRSSVPMQRSSLAKETSIDEVSSGTGSPDSRRTSFSELPKEHRGSFVDASDPAKIKAVEAANAIKEEEEESEEEKISKTNKLKTTKAEVAVEEDSEEKPGEETNTSEPKTKDEVPAGASVEN